ncbi:MAG: serine/threonine-protein kinase [Polyangiaceae bacterium]
MDPRRAVDPIEAERARAEVRARLFGGSAKPVEVGRFVVLERIGRGAMGVVYAARDPELDRKVAIKLLQIDSDASLLAEAKALARFSHPNAVSVYEIGTYAGHPFVAMEHVEGVSLARWLTAEPRAWRDVVRVFVGAGRGLAAAHAAGIVHRDFKPENVVVGTDQRPRVIDFGLARVVDEPRPDPELTTIAADGAAPGRAAAGPSRFAGTPAYMADELFEGHRATAASDQYAFAVALYQSLWKVAPFDAAPTASGRPRALRKPPRGDVPRRIAHALARGLAARPEDRFPSMDELLEVLERDPRALPLTVTALAAGLAVVVGVLLSRGHAPGPPLCEGGDARLGEVWNPAVRGRLHAAFASSGHPFARDVLGSVEPRLDAYGRDWAATYRESCLATNVRGEQSRDLLDRRTQCLERRRASRRAARTTLTESEGAPVERSVALVEALPPIDGCSDVASLSAAVPRPDDPATRSRLAELEGNLEEVRASFLAGALTHSAARVSALAGDAAELGYKPFAGEVAFLDGSIASAQGRPADAERALVDALKAAEVAGDAVLVARSATMLLGVTGTQQSKFDKARVWREVAAASVERVGDRRLSAELDDRSAVVLNQEGKVDEALASVERAVKGLEEIDAADTASYAGYLSDWGNILDSKGRYDEAIDRLKRALALRESLLGPKHPEVARTLNNLAVVYERRDQLELARTAYERAIAIAEEVGGMDSYSGFLDNLAGCLFTLGRSDEGFAMRLKAHALREKELPPDHPELGMSWNNLGVTYERLHRLDDALAAYESGIRIYRAAYGPDHPEIALTTSNIAEIHEAKGDLPRALELFREAIAMLERTNAETSTLARVVIHQGHAEAAMHRYPDAIRDLERGIAELERDGTYAMSLAKGRFTLARALWDSGDTSGARAMAAKARAGPFGENDASALLSEIDAWSKDHALR